jgi:transposase
VKHITAEELEGLIKNERSKRFAERLMFIRAVYDGEPAESVAKKLGRSRATGYNWLKRWNYQGVEGLKPTFNGGRHPKLSSTEREELKRKLESKGNWTTKEARKLIADKFSKTYSDDSIARILRSLGMRYAKPYPSDYRRPNNAEARLKSTVETLLEKLQDIETQENVLVGFLDECSPQSCANTARVWSFGKALIVKDTTKYRANTFGFYAPLGRSLVGFKENSKKESVCSFLEEVKTNNPDEKILLVLDNFPSHKAQATRDKAEELGISLTYLPPYSPDLSPIEQIWRGVKRGISAAFFRSRDEFLAIIANSYNQLSTQLSFAKGWLMKFLPQQSNQLCC